MSMETNSQSYTFPEGFWWGSSASATQTEGSYPGDGKGPNIWDHWFEKEPNRFFSGRRSRCNLAILS